MTEALISFLYLFQYFAFLILLGASAFFSSTETGFFSLNEIDKSALEEKYPALKKYFADLSGRAEQFLISILMGNTFVNVLLSSIMTIIAVNAIGDKTGQEEATAIAIPVITFIILIFGEITPKTYAFAKSRDYLPRILRFAYFYFRATEPVSWVLVFISTKLTGKAESRKKGLLTLEELKLMVDQGQEIDAEEKEMIHSIFKFGETSIREVMTPRHDIIAMSIKSTIRDCWEIYRIHQYSRIPVYQNNFDDIVGIFYSRDIFRFLDEPDRTLEQTDLRTVSFIPEMKNIEDQLLDFQKSRQHIAIVVDEYGGTSGIVTLEDILEEIVGEITDEKDEIEQNIIKIDDRTFLIRAKTSIEDISEILTEELPERNYETIGGFVYSKLGRVPKAGDTIIWNKYRFSIEKIQKRRILWVRLCIQD